MILPSRAVLLLLLCDATAFAQKKPVTLDALAQAPVPRAPEIQWSPGGRRFVFTQDGRIQLYDAASRAQREIISLAELANAAVKVPPSSAHGWENRRVSEQSVQWTPDGKSLVVSAGGDVFLVKLDAGGWVQLTATPIAERDPKLSPDGRKLAYRHNHNLYVLDIGGKQATQITHDGSDTLLNGELDWVYPEELDLETAYWWSPDSQFIAYLQLDTSREMIQPHVDLLPLFAIEEPQRYPKAGTPNADIRLGVVPAAGGRTRWMDLGELRDRLLARIYWTPDSAAIFAMRLNRVQNEMRLLSADARTGESKTILEEKDPFWINIKDDFRQLPKRNRFLIGSERDGYRHLYLYRNDGHPEAQLTTGEWEVTSLLQVDEAGGRVFFESTEESPLERHLYTVGLAGGERRKLTREKGVHTVSVSPSGEYWTDFFSSLATPPRLTLNDANGNVIATLRKPDTRLEEEYDIQPTELLNFHGSDGTLFYARLIKPRGFDPARKYPAIVMIYGGPHMQAVRNTYAGVSWDQALAARGFVIWQMDNRGSAGRGHLWESKIYHQFGKQELADQLEGVRHLVSLGFVDPHRTGITGWSYGGYMTLYALLHSPDTFRAGISGAPVTDWRNYDTIYTERYMGLPSDNPEGYENSSPVHFAKNLTGKLMLVHNFSDDNVLYQGNMQMQVELQKAGKFYDLLIYPQKSHAVTGPFARHMRRAMTDFFERTLRADPH